MSNASRYFRPILLAAGFLAAASIGRAAPAHTYRLSCLPHPPHAVHSLLGVRYGAADDYGFDLRPSPRISNAGCSAGEPFYVSVTEPEGNYLVTVTLGNAHSAAMTAVKAEARRLMVMPIATMPGQYVTRRFVVNIRTPFITSSERVHLKPREIGDLDWDHKLTLEFTGHHPSLRSLTIQPVHVPTVYLAGDSTVVDQEKAPWAAWGQILPAFFNDKIAIANEAESGETIRSFVAEKRLDKIMSTLRAGDYLFIQFAHNDQKPGPGFVSIPQYKEWLRRYIALARGKGAHPVLVTSMNRRDFNANGKIVPTLGDYPNAMRQVARQQHVPLIDLNAMSKTLFEAMGAQGTLKAFVHFPANTFPDQPKPLADNTHFTSYGALELARCIVQGIRRAHLPIAKDIRASVPPFDPAHPDPPSIWNLPHDPFITVKTPYER
jgi:lysophospholipase L1-like esterase